MIIFKWRLNKIERSQKCFKLIMSFTVYLHVIIKRRVDQPGFQLPTVCHAWPRLKRSTLTCLWRSLICPRRRFHSRRWATSCTQSQKDGFHPIAYKLQFEVQFVSSPHSNVINCSIKTPCLVLVMSASEEDRWLWVEQIQEACMLEFFYCIG